MRNKKITISLCALITLSAGCASNQTTTVSNATEPFFTVGDTTISKGDIYEYMKLQNLDSGIIAMAETDLVNQLVPVTDEMNATVDERVAADKELYGEETFLTMINYYGFADEQAYRDAYLTNIQITELTKQYVDDNWDAMIEKYNPRKAVVLSFVETTSDTESDETTEGDEATTSQAQQDAQAAYEALSSGEKDLQTIIDEYDLTAEAEPQLYTTEDTSLTNLVRTYIQTNQPGYSTPVYDDSNGTPTYYVVYLADIDPNNFKDEVLEELASNNAVAEESDQYYLKSNGFFVYDQMILDALRTNYNDYLTEEQAVPSEVVETTATE